LAALVLPGSASERPHSGCKTADAPKPVQWLDQSELRSQAPKECPGAIVPPKKIAFLLAGRCSSDYTGLRLENEWFSRFIRYGNNPFRQAFCLSREVRLKQNR